MALPKSLHAYHIATQSQVAASQSTLNSELGRVTTEWTRFNMAQVTNGVKSKVWTFLDYMMFVYIDIHTKPHSTELIKVQCGLMAPQDLQNLENKAPLILICYAKFKKRKQTFSFTV